MKRHDIITRLVKWIILTLVLSGCNLQTEPTKAIAAVDPSFALDQAAQLSADQQYSAAIKILEEAAVSAEADPRPLIEIGRIYVQQGRWTLATTTFLHALERQPGNRAATVGLAEAWLGKGEAVESTNYWRQAIDLDPAQVDGWVGLGRAYLARREYDQASDAFATALDRGASADAAWYLATLTLPADLSRGRALLEDSSGHGEGRDHLLAAIKPFTSQTAPAEIAKIVGIALIQLGEWPTAHHALLIATQLDPTDPQSWAFLGHVQGQLGLPAIDSFNRGRDLAPDLALVPYFEGIYLRQIGYPKLAVERFLTAMDDDPNNLGVALEAARTLEAMGDYLSAEAWYQGMVQLEPDSPLYQEYLTAFYVEKSYRVLDAGLPAAERLIELTPDNARALTLLGWAQYQAGQVNEAEASLRRAIELAPTDITPRYYLGRLLQSQHRTIEAQAEFTRVIDWDRSGLFRQRLLGAD